MKKYLVFAAAASLFAACSSDDLPAEKQIAAQEAGDGAVVFDAYQSRSTTRAGAEGTMTLSLLRAANAGFGVFSYYTNNEGYSELAKPDFMYNQKVSWDGSWKYEPIKYWPNEFGTEAASERVDYLTFFAYAPYVTSDPKTGKVSTSSSETGIVGLTRNTTLGDPLVKYVVDFRPDQMVDLCWGVAAEDFTESVTSSAPTNNIAQNSPFIDVIKPMTTSKIKFDFKHALTQLNVQIDTDVDVESHAGDEADSKTRIFVRSVTFEGFTDRGTLNLNSKWSNTNPTPIWYDFSGNGNLSTHSITIYDKRYDGREGVENVAAPAESPLGLNDKIIQSKPYITEPAFSSDAADPGVTHTAVNLFNDATATTPILVIPNNQPMKVKVVYDVETYDPSLAEFLSDGKTHGSTIENAITQEIKLASGSPMILESGKKYTVKLHLGLTSVKFDASVSPWTDEPVATGEADTDLPINSGSAAVVSSGGSLNASVPAAAGSYSFTLTDAEGTITRTDVSPTDGATVTNSGNVVTINYIANDALTEKAFTVNVADASSHTASVTFTQAPVALGLKILTPAVGAGNTFKLGADAAVADWSAASITKTITRKRGSATTTITPSAVAADGTVTLTDAAQAGDLYTITVQAGDAAAETVSFVVEKAVGTLTAFGTPAVNYSIAAPSVLNQTTTRDGDGEITYSIAKTSGSGATTASIVSDTGVVTLTSATAGDVFTVTATVADGVNYTYPTKTTTYTITIVN